MDGFKSEWELAKVVGRRTAIRAGSVVGGVRLQLGAAITASGEAIDRGSPACVDVPSAAIPSPDLRSVSPEQTPTSPVQPPEATT